jgi:hypothetical protein
LRQIAVSPSGFLESGGHSARRQLIACVVKIRHPRQQSKQRDQQQQRDVT